MKNSQWSPTFLPCFLFRNLLLLFALLLTSLGISSFLNPAQAQPMQYLQERVAAHFNKEDFHLLDEAVQTVNEKGVLGGHESWKNPKTGSHGTLTLLEKVKHGDQICHRVEVQNSAKHEEKEERGKAVFTYCKVSTEEGTQGKWKILR